MVQCVLRVLFVCCVCVCVCVCYEPLCLAMQQAKACSNEEAFGLNDIFFFPPPPSHYPSLFFSTATARWTGCAA